MEPDKNTSSDTENPELEKPDTDASSPKESGDSLEASPTPDAQAPADALSRTPEDLQKEEEERKASGDLPQEAPKKKVSPIKRLFKKVNVYFLSFVIVVIIAGAITVVNYLNSQQAPAEPNIATQQLSEDALKQLAQTDATVGNTSQTLTIQGNAIIAGQTLMRGNLNVAGNIQAGGSLQAPTLTVSGATNLGATQINSLQVATDTAIQGTTTVRDLNVSGASSFSGAMTASQITVTKLIISGSGVLQIPNHISFTGPAPTRTVNGAVVGTGGTVSISGSDTSGIVSINTGNSTTPGCFARITFQQPFATLPHVIISPIGSAAGQAQYYVDRNTTGFSICTANAALANQSFGYDYFVSN